MDILGLFLSAINQEDPQQTSSFYGILIKPSLRITLLDRILDQKQGQLNLNPLNQQVPQNMQQIYETYEHAKSDPNEFLNSLIRSNQPIHSEKKQCQTIIVASNPQMEENSKKEEKEDVVEEEGEKDLNEDNKGINDFLLLSKVATMYNQLNYQEKMQKKEKMEKKLKQKQDEEKEGDDKRNKSKKM